MSNHPVIALPTAQRRELFELAADSLTLPAMMIEKDFWVCWTLQQLFTLPGASDHLIFKGGTSLSKVWRAIERFSEDIDISLSREWLGFSGQRDPEAATSRKQRERLLEQLAAACAAKLKDDVAPALRKTFTEALGPSGWSLEVDPADPQTLLFAYPSTMDDDRVNAYVRRIVKIECGARSDRWPVVVGHITSYVTEAYPQTSDGIVTDIPVLSIERTFWEKATILHAEAHRPVDKEIPSRFSRHYADLAALAVLDAGKRAVKDGVLRERVVAHKRVFFAAAWASYDTAVTGQFKLIPSPQRLAALERDYQSMQLMFFKTPLTWSEVVARLQVLELEINSGR